MASGRSRPHRAQPCADVENRQRIAWGRGMARPTALFRPLLGGFFAPVTPIGAHPGRPERSLSSWRTSRPFRFGFPPVSTRMDAQKPEDKHHSHGGCTHPSSADCRIARGKPPLSEPFRLFGWFLPPGSTHFPAHGNADCRSFPGLGPGTGQRSAPFCRFVPIQPGACPPSPLPDPRPCSAASPPHRNSPSGRSARRAARRFPSHRSAPPASTRWFP